MPLAAKLSAGADIMGTQRQPQRLIGT